VTARFIQIYGSTNGCNGLLSFDYYIGLIRQRQNIDEYHDFLELLMTNSSENEILLFFSRVGFETSSQLLASCSYCLALNPDCQEKLYNEIRERMTALYVFTF